MEITVNYTELLINILLCGLAVFRYTLLIHAENGPWHVFDWLRFKAGISIEIEQRKDLFNNKWYDHKKYKGEGFFAELLSCPYCVSGWFSILLLPAIVLPIFFDFHPVLQLVWLPFEAFALLGATWGIAYLVFRKLGH